jgi:hypothetical protein
MLARCVGGVGEIGSPGWDIERNIRLIRLLLLTRAGGDGRKRDDGPDE